MTDRRSAGDASSRPELALDSHVAPEPPPLPPPPPLSTTELRARLRARREAERARVATPRPSIILADGVEAATDDGPPMASPFDDDADDDALEARRERADHEHDVEALALTVHRARLRRRLTTGAVVVAGAVAAFVIAQPPDRAPRLEAPQTAETGTRPAEPGPTPGTPTAAEPGPVPSSEPAPAGGGPAATPTDDVAPAEPEPPLPEPVAAAPADPVAMATTEPRAAPPVAAAAPETEESAALVAPPAEATRGPEPSDPLGPPDPVVVAAATSPPAPEIGDPGSVAGSSEGVTPAPAPAEPGPLGPPEPVVVAGPGNAPAPSAATEANEDLTATAHELASAASSALTAATTPDDDADPEPTAETEGPSLTRSAAPPAGAERGRRGHANPTSAADWYAAGRRLSTTSPRDALYAFRRAATRGYAVAYREIGRLEAARGRSAAAVAAYRRYLRSYPRARDAERVRERIVALGGR